MVKLGEEPRLAGEAPRGRVVVRDLAEGWLGRGAATAQDLQGDERAVEQVARPPDGAHSSGPRQGEDLEAFGHDAAGAHEASVRQRRSEAKGARLTSARRR